MTSHYYKVKLVHFLHKPIDIMQDFSVVFWGAPNTGKTKLVRCLNNQSINHAYHPTIGFLVEQLTYQSKQVNKAVKLELFDVSGSDKTTTKLLQKNKVMGVYCINASLPIDKDLISQEIALFRSLNPTAKIILVGTHIDQCNNKDAVNQQLQELSETFDAVELITTSIFTREGIQLLKNKIELEMEKYITQLELAFFLEKMNPASQFYAALSKFNTTVYLQLSTTQQKLICLELLELFNSLSSMVRDYPNKHNALTKFTSNCKEHLGIIEEKKAYSDALGISIGLPIVFSPLIGIIAFSILGLAAVPISILIFAGIMQLLAGVILWATLTYNYGSKELDQLESEFTDALTNMEMAMSRRDNFSSHLEAFIEFKKHGLEKTYKDPEQSKSLQLAKHLNQEAKTTHTLGKIFTNPENASRIKRCGFFKSSIEPWTVTEELFGNNELFLNTP